jgi:hypothetical protein
VIGVVVGEKEKDQTLKEYLVYENVLELLWC